MLHANGYDPLAPLATRRVQRSLSLDANPFLKDHMIGGQAVLPTVCALEWMGNTAEQLYPGYTFFRAENYRVLKGIVFDDTLAPVYTVEVKEADKSIKGQILLDVLISSQTPQGKPRYHYSVRLHLIDQTPAAPSYPNADLSVTDGEPGLPLYTERHIVPWPQFSRRAARPQLQPAAPDARM